VPSARASGESHDIFTSTDRTAVSASRGIVGKRCGVCRKAESVSSTEARNFVTESRRLALIPVVGTADARLRLQAENCTALMAERSVRRREKTDNEHGIEALSASGFPARKLHGGPAPEESSTDEAGYTPAADALRHQVRALNVTLSWEKYTSLCGAASRFPAACLWFQHDS
jgi:hypothetical protein